MSQLDKYETKIQENINRLSQGQVDVNVPEFSVSSNNLRLTVQESEKVSGTVEITSTDSVSGIVICDNVRMSLESNEFYGKEDVIKYTFDAAGYQAGDIVKGSICLICDGGEQVITYTVTVVEKAQPDNKASYDKLKEKYFKQSEEHFSYLISGEGKEGNCFNFDTFEDKKYEICIDKYGTGGDGFTLVVDDPIISLDRYEISESDFVGGRVVVYATVDRQKLHIGNNYTMLRLVYDLGSVGAEIKVCNPSASKNEAKEKLRRIEKYRQELLKIYIAYRIGNYDAKTFGEKVDPIVSTLLVGDENSTEFILYRIHQLIIAHQKETARLMLLECSEKIAGKDAQLYGYYMYLSSLISDDSGKRYENVTRIKQLCQEHREANVLLWMRLQMDKELINNPSARIKMIRHQYAITGLDTLLLLEASNAFALSPKLLVELGDFELHIMNFAFKCGLVHERLGREFINCARKVTKYVPKLLRMLKSMYKATEHSRDILSTVCMQLIKGDKKDDDAFDYYCRAVDKGINITKLYDYFLSSMPESYAKELPGVVLRYFTYQNQIGERERAVLYANIALYSQQNPAVLKDYRKAIESFGCEMAEQRKINGQLAVIYKYLYDNKKFGSLFEADIERFVFTHRVIVSSSRIKKVVLVQRSLKEETIWPVIKDEAYIPVFDKDYVLFGELENGNRIAGFNFYDEMLFDPLDYVDVMTEMEIPSLGTALYLTQQIEDNEKIFRFIKYLLESEKLASKCERELSSRLIKYYAKSERDETQKEVFLGIQIEKLGFADRDLIVTRLLEYGEDACDIKVLEFIKNHGIYGLDGKTLLAAAGVAIEAVKHQMDAFALWLCTESFLNRCSDMKTVAYLCSYAQGTSKHLRKIWTRAKEFPAIDLRGFEEKLLIQMLYSKSFVGERERIFESYENNISYQNVALAWLTNLAYEAVHLDVIMDESFYDSLLRLRKNGYMFNDYCALALIYYFADMDHRYTSLDLYNEITKETIAFHIRDFLARKIVLKCFMAYRDLVEELSVFDSCVFVEYKANPGCAVTLHYMIEGDQEELNQPKEESETTNEKEQENYHNENMKNVICGIFSKVFVLFYGECIQYYITESNMDEKVITESQIQYPPKKREHLIDNGYDVINDMLMYHDKGEGESLVKLMDVYRRRNFVGEHIFKILV